MLEAMIKLMIRLFFDVIVLAHRLEQLYEITNMPYNRKESVQGPFQLLP